MYDSVLRKIFAIQRGKFRDQNAYEKRVLRIKVMLRGTQNVTLKTPETLDIKRKNLRSLGIVGFSSWQGMRDSNPRKRSQSPVCYRYTNPLNDFFPKRMIIITISCKKSRLIFSFLQKLKWTLKKPVNSGGTGNDCGLCGVFAAEGRRSCFFPRKTDFLLHVLRAVAFCPARSC